MLPKELYTQVKSDDTPSEKDVCHDHLNCCIIIKHVGI